MAKSLSKSARFEIFKRDGFTCQYCGRKPPDVILNVDHILAKANGGGDTEDNLISACSDCNGGKSAKPLDRTLAPINFSVEEREERMEQIRQYQEQLHRERIQLEEYIELVVRHWIIREGQDVDADVWLIPPRLRETCRRFLKRLPPEEVIDAIEICHQKFHETSKDNFEYFNYGMFKYFCGVCWKKIKDKEVKPCT